MIAESESPATSRSFDRDLPDLTQCTASRGTPSHPATSPAMAAFAAPSDASARHETTQ